MTKDEERGFTTFNQLKAFRIMRCDAFCKRISAWIFFLILNRLYLYPMKKCFATWYVKSVITGRKNGLQRCAGKITFLMSVRIIFKREC
ncbi:hypothetical protein F0D84_09380 [Escherichia coli]|nr:hypothetical protein AM366_10025 [Escherichia coli]AZL00259.1 hypothetical protein CTM43_07745 [Klebsiella pneumoniae]EFK51101.1 hypothetical protein HMPREF9345_02474 [Escherichia coli MS 107-1]EGU96814.1 hypothetical protein HMPREF9349_03226 [Escherichia coli MS 79-10]ARX55718.1 hypothetical protein AM375_10965 [Escherichia coli]